MKGISILVMILLCSSYTHSIEEGTYSSPSSGGDVRMGSDAIHTGTDKDDKYIQAQEAEGKIQSDEILKKTERTKDSKKEEFNRRFN